MEVSYKNNLATPFLTLVMLLFLTTSNSLAQSKDAKGDYAIEGNTSILSHFVHHGLSQTQSDPSLQTSIFIPLGPQFRIGLWGSNVSYEGANNHIWLKVVFDLKIEFNKDVDFVIGYNINQFFKDRLRNGNTTRLGLNIFDYRISYENETNWEGTETSSRYVGFGKAFKFYGNFEWDNQIGYTMVEVTTLQSYFDLRSSISSSYNKLDFHVAVTATSNPSQFNGHGDIFGIIGMGFKY
jgi:uncharacterized protein (TIGR02001 family)